MKSLFKILIAAGIVAASASTYAWGEREQGALAGIVGALVIQQAIQNNAQPRIQYQPQPVYVAPPRPVYEYVPTNTPVYRRYEQYDPNCNCIRYWDIRVQ